MRTVEKATIVALALFCVSIWIVLAAGLTAVWLTEEVRVFGLVILLTMESCFRSSLWRVQL